MLVLFCGVRVGQFGGRIVTQAARPKEQMPGCARAVAGSSRRPDGGRAEQDRDPYPQPRATSRRKTVARKRASLSRGGQSRTPSSRGRTRRRNPSIGEKSRGPVEGWRRSRRRAVRDSRRVERFGRGRREFSIHAARSAPSDGAAPAAGSGGSGWPSPDSYEDARPSDRGGIGLLRSRAKNGVSPPGRKTARPPG